MTINIDIEPDGPAAGTAVAIQAKEDGGVPASEVDALGLTYELAPSTEECLRARGQGCIHTVALEPVAREAS